MGMRCVVDEKCSVILCLARISVKLRSICMLVAIWLARYLVVTVATLHTVNCVHLYMCNSSANLATDSQNCHVK